MNNQIYNPKNEDNLYNYLTGLIEGDGHIYVPKTKYSDKKNYPSIQICFHLKDLPLCMKIQQALGFGSIHRKKGVNAYVFTINAQKDVLDSINFLNGRMRTPKLYYLHNLIDWFPELNLKKLPINKEPLTNNSWLAGFVEADGHFSIRATNTQKYPRVECRLEITQRQVDLLNNNNLEFLIPIAELCNTRVEYIREDTKHPQFRVRTLNILGTENTINYFKEYPLFGTKYLNYKDFVAAFELFKRKDLNYVEECIKIKNQMNDCRTIWNWDHLINFYSINK